MSQHLTSLSGRLRVLRRTLGPLSLALAQALAFSLTFTACGGGGGGGSSTTPVVTALSIGTQPANATAALGATVTFTVVAAGGTAPYAYQWSKTPKGGTASAIAGATSASYTTPALALADDGASFTVTVKDAANASVTSNAATLTVTPPASHLAVTLADQTVASGATATFTPVVTGGKEPYAYVWKKGGAVIDGATSATYATAAATSADDGAQYFVSVTDSATPPATATATAVLHVTNPSLTTLLNTKLSPVPAITFFQRKSDGGALTGSSVQVNQQITVPGENTIGSISSVAVGTSGHFRAQTYPIRLMGDPGQNVGARLESLTVSQDATLTYQTSKQSWAVALNGWASMAGPGQPFHQPLNNYQVDIYQCDSEGRVAWGQTEFASPLVLSVTGSVAADAKTLVFETELFKGTYRAVFTPKYDTVISAGIPVTFSDRFTAAGGGANENQTLTLPGLSGIKTLTLKLTPRASLSPFTAADFSVSLRDKTTLIPVDSRKILTDGTVTFTTNLPDVTAVVTDLRSNSPSKDSVVAIHPYTGLTADTPTATLTQYNVKGLVTAPVSIPDTAMVNVALNSGLSDANGAPDLGSLGFSVTLNAAAFAIDLFEGDWSVSAKTRSIPQCPDGPTVPFTLNADKTDADIAIAAGGVIFGTLQTKAAVPLAGIRVDLVDPSSLEPLKSTATDADGKYTFYVPFGTTYHTVVNADAHVPTDLIATSGKPTVIQNLVQYSVSGRITDGSQGVVTNIKAGNSTAVSAVNGTFSLNLFEGLNYIWIEPQDKSSNLGPVLFTNVLVNATTAQ